MGGRVAIERQNDSKCSRSALPNQPVLLGGTKLCHLVVRAEIAFTRLLSLPPPSLPVDYTSPHTQTWIPRPTSFSSLAY